MPFKKNLPTGIGRREFIALIASMMAISALAIDTMLPAFGAMSADFGLIGANANHIQWVIYAFMTGFSFAQLFYGAMADYWGRKPIVLIGVAIFSLATLGAALAPNFTVLLVMRVFQGIGMAAMRVLSTTIVRDTFSGADMSRVSSMIMMVFILVPVFAPTLGQALLFGFSWHSIFWVLLVFGLALSTWFMRRMPETLKPEFRRPISIHTLLDSLRQCVRSRTTLGYATATGLMYGVLMTYLGSSEQIFQRNVYGLNERFALLFGAVAMFMGGAAFINSRWVGKLGVRRMAHTALLVFVGLSGLLVIVSLIFSGKPPLMLFVPMLAGCLFCFSLMMPNFNAISMEPLRAIAGSASSWTGFYTSFMGAMIGNLIGQMFNGTVLPLAVGYFLIGLLVLWIIYRTEGRLWLRTPFKVV
jgi:DHA1 family bicyclomycin/chloramphenicol resistance-like MFS transporter